MKKYFAISLLALAGALPQSVMSQSFELSEKALEFSWPQHDWNGQHAFPPVYCTNFQSPKDAMRLSTAMFNRNSISLTRVIYKDDVALFLVTSTIPVGRTPEEDMVKSQENNRRNAAAGPAYFKTEDLSSPFGLTVGLTIRNSRDGGLKSPFPLAYSAVATPDGLLRSLSVHRLFARGPDRFEVAALKLFSTSISSVEEQAQVNALTAFVDGAVNELYKCTSQLPIRSRK